MQRTRIGWLAVATTGLLAVTGVTALAAGETVNTTVKASKVTKIKPSSPGQSKFSWGFTIAKPDGSRAANLSSADLTLPKGTFVDTKGFQTCPQAKIEANDVNSCPAKSIVGHATADIYSSPIREQPYASTGVIYFTGMKGKTPQFTTYFTLVEIPSAHGLDAISISRSGATSKIHMEQPHIPTAPGLPDATPLDIHFNFDAKGAKGTLFRQAKPCKSGTKVPAKYGFYDGSSTSSSAKAC